LSLIVKVDDLDTESVESVNTLSKLFNVFCVLADVGKLFAELEGVDLVHLVSESVDHLSQTLSLVFITIACTSRRTSVPELVQLLPYAIDLLEVSFCTGEGVVDVHFHFLVVSVVVDTLFSSVNF